MYKFDINQADFYEYGKPELKERTKCRLIEISNNGLYYLGFGEFGYRGIMSGLYIEFVWNYPDDIFDNYLEWASELIKTKTQ